MGDLGNKEIFSKNLKKYMRINNKDRLDICNDLQIAYTTFTDWYNGNTYPRIDKIELLARYFNIEKSDLIEEKHFIKGRIPVLGVVKAGYNYLAEENIIGYLTVDSSLDNENYFALQVKGNSMEPIIFEGDIAVVKKQNVFENGDIVVAIVNGNEATIKKAYKTDSGLLLQPANTSIEPLLFMKNEIKDVPVKIIGVVYNITRNFKK